jgi:GT2 family glycosyltransferase
LAIKSIAALITCFNRRQHTLTALTTLFQQKGIQDIHLKVFLVDDGCTDGTGEAVRSGFPQVSVLKGNGSLFWDGGMRMAYDAAMKEGFDAYLLFNDDTKLYDDALIRLVNCADAQLAKGQPTIITGTTITPGTTVPSYGGKNWRVRGLAKHLLIVAPDPERAIFCDTMNGNFVLVPKEITRVLGNLEKGFTQQFGDFDYGLRAQRAGFKVAIAPGFSGECRDNPTTGTFRDPAQPFSRRWKSLMSPKGTPLPDWWIFTTRHFGWRWPLYFASPYLKTLTLGILPQRLKTRMFWGRVEPTPAQPFCNPEREQ